MCKVISIPSLVWLRRTVRRWRSRAAASVGPDHKETDAAGVPPGRVAVRVDGGREGDGCRRFVVRLTHLTHPAFLELLRQAEEEYGFSSISGPIALPCDEHRLRDVLRRVSSSEEQQRLRSLCCWAPVSRGVAKRRRLAAAAAGDGRGEARLVIDRSIHRVPARRT